MITLDEFFNIAQDLECYHGIFSRLWQMGRPVVNDKIPTAAVTFDKEGNYFGFNFNPKFWASLDDYNRKFVICHEALHLILYHGARLKGKHPEIGNIAADVVINESLVKNFGFDRKRVMNQAELCWYDTVFPNGIEKERSMDFYYNELIKNAKTVNVSEGGKGQPQSGGKGEGKGQCRTVDTHGEFEGGEAFGDSDSQQEIDGKVEEACDALSDKEVDNLKKAVEKSIDDESKTTKQAGSTAGGVVKVMVNVKVVKKSKWETVIKRWMQKYMYRSDKSKDQWARINRRFCTVQSLSAGKIFIPTEMETDSFADENRRVQVMFFLDTSGSCAHLADRFWKAASSLPEERFDIRLFCFDTQIYETSFASKKLYGFGGTSFHIIEDYIQQDMKKKKTDRYPDAIFIITDGYGDNVSPVRPERWYWFLSENYQHCIPPKSNKFMLKDYE